MADMADAFFRALVPARKVDLHPTTRHLPDSPSVIAADIASAEYDIQCWEQSIADARESIRRDEIDISLKQGNIHRLKAKLAAVDRRVAQIGLAEYYGRRRAADLLSGVAR